MDREHLISRLGLRRDVLVGAGPWRSWDVGSPVWRTAGLKRREVRRQGTRTDVPPAWLVEIPRWPWTGRAARAINAWRYRCILGAPADAFAGLIFHPAYWRQLQAARPRAVVYHVYDNYRKIPDWNEELEAIDVDLLRAANVVSATSRKLCDLLEHTSGRQVEFLPNGVDYGRFSKRVETEPEDINVVPRPRIGYTGRLNRKVDFELFYELACARPDWNFVMVGPTGNMDGTSNKWYQKCVQRANIRFLGEKPVHALPAYVASMDVNLMCYAQRANLWTPWIYPLKLHEYLATGKPIVSADLDSVREFSSVVRIATTTEEWISAIERALEESDTEIRKARRETAARNSWDNRVELLDGWLRELAVG